MGSNFGFFFFSEMTESRSSFHHVAFHSKSSFRFLSLVISHWFFISIDVVLVSFSSLFRNLCWYFPVLQDIVLLLLCFTDFQSLPSFLHDSYSLPIFYTFTIFLPSQQTCSFSCFLSLVFFVLLLVSIVAITQVRTVHLLLSSYYCKAYYHLFPSARITKK